MWIQLEFYIFKYKSVQIFDFLKLIQNFKSWYWKIQFSFTKLNRQMVVLEPMNFDINMYVYVSSVPRCI